MRILIATALAATTTLSGLAVTTTSAFAQGGSYQASCRNVASLGNGFISAECADGSGRYRSSTLQASACQGDIGNQNGILACNGAVAQAGAYVPGQNDNRRDRDRGNNNLGTALGAGALGAVAGAFLGSNLYQGQYNYPDYGQRGYGDPRYDPRYAQGGWGYGYQSGQYVPISRRADWLDRRIEEGVRRGSLSRREANSLDRELQDLVRLEQQYGRNGFSNWERTDMDNRFDNLAARIRFESRDYDNRNNGYDNRGYNNNGGGYGGGYNNDRRY
jgi:hypothetical protein